MLPAVLSGSKGQAGAGAQRCSQSFRCHTGPLRAPCTALMRLATADSSPPTTASPRCPR